MILLYIVNLILFKVFLNLAVMERCVGKRKLDSILSQWNEFSPMEGKFTVHKSTDPMNERILDVKRKLEFAPHEALTPFNMHHLIPVFNHKYMFFNAFKKGLELNQMDGRKIITEKRDTEYIACDSSKRRKLSTDDNNNVLQKFDEEKEDIPTQVQEITSTDVSRKIEQQAKSCDHETKYGSVSSCTVRSTV